MRLARFHPVLHRNPSSWLQMRIGSLLSLVCVSLLAARCNSVSGQEQSSQLSASGSVEIGLSGTWKVGFPTRHRLRINQPVEKADAEIHSVDGDGVAVQFVLEDISPSGNSQHIEVYVPHGRSNSPIRAELRRSTGTPETLVQHSIQEDRGIVLPATHPWVVCLGSSMGVESLATRTPGNPLSSFVTTVLEQPQELPEHFDGYRGVDLLLIATDTTWFEGVSERQSKAIIDWVQFGGRVVVSVGKNGERVGAVSWIASLLPGSILDVKKDVSGGPIESWIGSSHRIDSLDCTRIAVESVVPDISLVTRTRESIPLVVRRAHGFGQVVFVATDIGSGSLANWEDRPALLRRLMPSQWEQWTSPQESRSGQISQFGFDDLSGQLRATLDFFPSVQIAGLTWMAVLLLGIILWIGPLDYFLFVRRLRKTSWTWMSLAMVASIACVSYASLRNQWKPSGTIVNECTVWDVDAATSLAKSRSWFHIYSGVQELRDVTVRARSETVVKAPASTSRMCSSLWSGLPGKGLGGFESSVMTDQGMPHYQIVRENGSADRLKGLGIPLAGTKAIEASWSGESGLDFSGTHLGLVPGSDLLSGQWIQPLECDLLNAVVMFRNWQYSLPTRIVPGQRIEFSISVTPKDLARQLQRRRIVDGNEKGSKWQPLEREDTQRLMEMLLFHRAAGGTTYTELTHRYLQSMDLSDLLRLNRAIVFGRLEIPTTEIEVTSHSTPSPIAPGRRECWVRMVIPVDIGLSSTPKSSTAP